MQKSSLREEGAFRLARELVLSQVFAKGVCDHRQLHLGPKYAIRVSHRHGIHRDNRELHKRGADIESCTLLILPAFLGSSQPCAQDFRYRLRFATA